MAREPSDGTPDRLEADAEPRDRIVASLAGLLASMVYDQVSIRAIVASARVSTSTFYEHFASKDDVLDVLHVRWCDAVRDDLRGHAAEMAGRPLREVIHWAIARVLTEQRRWPGVRRALEESTLPAIQQRRRAFLEEMFDHFAGAAKTGGADVAAPDVRFTLEFGARTALAAIYSYVESGLERPLSSELSDRQFVAALVEVALAYLDSRTREG